MPVASARRVTHDCSRFHFLHGVSPDGSMLAFVELPAGELSAAGRLATISSQGGGTTDLSFPPGTLGHPPDLDVEGRLVRTDNRAEPVARFPIFGGQGTLNVNNWAPDSTECAFVGYPSRRRNDTTTHAITETAGPALSIEFARTAPTDRSAWDDECHDSHSNPKDRHQVHLLLIRHGQTPSNVAGALDTAVPGAPLTRLGHAQADAVPGALAGETIAGVYASALIRTQLTATPLAVRRTLSIEVQDGLEEIPAADLEMRTDDDARREYAACVSAWMSGERGRAMPGGGMGHDFYARFDAAIGSIVRAHHGDDTIAVFSHGAAIRVFTSLATNLPARQAVELSIANTGMARLERASDGAWTLLRWHSDPIGGRHLLDDDAEDTTGDSAVDELTPET